MVKWVKCYNNRKSQPPFLLVSFIRYTHVYVFDEASIVKENQKKEKEIDVFTIGNKTNI